MELLHPGLYLNETGGVPRIVGVSTSTAGAVGFTKKGPIDKLGFVTSWGQFSTVYGSYYRGSYLPLSMSAFFDNGGKRAYIGRVLHDDYDTSTANFEDLSGDQAFSATAANPGAWGDDISITTTRWETLLTADASASATELTVASVQDVARGDIVVVDDGVDTIHALVYNVNLSQKKLSVIVLSSTAELGVGATVKCATSHQGSSLSMSDLEDGATMLEVVNTNGFREGSVIGITDGTNYAFAVVTNVSGTKVYFDAIDTGGATLAANSLVVTYEFNLKVLELGQIVEPTHLYLSLEESNEQNYIEARLNGEGNASNYIVLEDLASTGAIWQKIPLPVTNARLSGGADGSTPEDNDYIGSQEPGQETGMHLFDRTIGVNSLAIPGMTNVAVQGALIDYCTLRHARAHPTVAVSDVPEMYDTPLEVQDWRMNGLNKDTSHAAMYYPWIKMASPTVSGQIITVPPSGYIMGLYARIDKDRGVHKAPANEPLMNCLGVTYNVTEEEQDLLHPIGINCIRVIPGRGIRVMGARTMTSVMDGRHYLHKRRVLNFIEESVISSIGWSVYEPNNEDLWDSLRLAINLFYNGLWKDGVLQPRDDKTKAYFTKVDEENNPLSKTQLGVVTVESGVNVVDTAEFVIYSVGLWDGGQLLNELVA